MIVGPNREPGKTSLRALPPRLSIPSSGGWRCAQATARPVDVSELQQVGLILSAGRAGATERAAPSHDLVKSPPASCSVGPVARALRAVDCHRAIDMLEPGHEHLANRTPRNTVGGRAQASADTQALMTDQSCCCSTNLTPAWT